MAFDRAKEALSTAPTLAFFNTKKETRLYTDASTLGIVHLLFFSSSSFLHRSYSKNNTTHGLRVCTIRKLIYHKCFLEV